MAFSSPPLCLLVVTTVFTEGSLGVNGNLLNYPETVTPYHYNWAPLGGGVRMSCVPPQKGPSFTGREGGDQNHSTS